MRPKKRAVVDAHRSSEFDASVMTKPMVVGGEIATFGCADLKGAVWASKRRSTAST